MAAPGIRSGLSHMQLGSKGVKDIVLSFTQDQDHAAALHAGIGNHGQKVAGQVMLLKLHCAGFQHRTG